tara:strand:- start:287 stop:760 length:474 start_codon:yes stop_codon:yes gene_type:complete
MAKKPSAARGKATRKGTLTKAVKQIRKILELMEDPSKGKGMSPGAMGGRTKPKVPSQFLGRRKKLSGMGPMIGTKPSSFIKRREGLTKPTGRMSMADMTRAAAMAAGKGSGKSLSKAGIKGMNKTLFTEAKKLKPSGRLNVDDIKRTREMLKKRKGK